MISNFKKYKRLFTFGCSFTRHKWPTWAHILSQEIDPDQLYNFARPGGGNFLIGLRVAEANKRYQFTDTDLIGIMWTSYTREDRYVKDQWISCGNVFNQSVYPENFVRDFCDPTGYMIRDYGVMELTSGYLKSLPCDSFQMLGWKPDLIENVENLDIAYDSKIFNDVKTVYKNHFDSFPMDMRSYIEKTYWSTGVTDQNHFDMVGHTYMMNGKLHRDGHPKPNVFYDYLQHLKFPLTEKSYNFAKESTAMLESCKTDQEIWDKFLKTGYIKQDAEARGMIF